MNCSRFETLLTDYLDRSLDPRVQAAATEHVTACPNCALLLHEVEKLQAELNDFPEISPPVDLVDRILDKTSGKFRVRSLWVDLILPTLRPFLTQRYAFATAIIFVFLSLVANLAGPDFSALSYSDLSPSKIIERADRVSSQIFKRWTQIRDAQSRLIGEIRLLKEDLYGRLDYHLVTLLFKSYTQSIQEQEKKGETKK